MWIVLDIRSKIHVRMDRPPLRYSYLAYNFEESVELSASTLVKTMVVDEAWQALLITVHCILSLAKTCMKRIYACINYLQSDVPSKYLLPVKSMGWTLISGRVLIEVKLMIILGVPPLTSS